METINMTNPSVTVRSLADLGGAASEARKAVRILDNQLLTLRLNLGSLKAALESAFAPIASALLPGLNAAIRGLRDFCDDAGTVIAALFGTVYKKSVTTAKKTGAALRRTLASFDQINRLQGGGSGGTEKETTLVPADRRVWRVSFEGDGWCDASIYLDGVLLAEYELDFDDNTVDQTEDNLDEFEDW